MLTLTILCLLLYCSPGSKYAAIIDDEESPIVDTEVKQALVKTTDLLNGVSDRSLVRSVFAQSKAGRPFLTCLEVQS